MSVSQSGVKGWSIIRCSWVVLAVAALAACHGPAAPPSASAPDAAPRPAPDALWLSNGHVRLAASPSLGRIVWFGESDGVNRIWLADPRPDPSTGYANVGGDKLWPAPQSMWPKAYHQPHDWPPGPVIDGQPWEVVAADGYHIVMRSRVSPALGVRVRRSITLTPGEPEARIVNSVTRVKPGDVPVVLWTITQVRPPSFVLLDTTPDHHAADSTDIVALQQPDHLAFRIDELGPAVQWNTAGAPEAKLGTMGRWIAAVWDDAVLVERADFDLDASYPDRSNVQSYTCGDYTEIELNGPATTLDPGESVSNTVIWRLVPRDGRSAEAIAQQLDEDATR